MGAVLAKFRKEQSTEKKLEQLEEKIQALEKYTFNTQETKKRFVGTFLAVSVGIYVIAAIAIIYFVYFPKTWKDFCLYIALLLIFPFLIICLRRLFTWYFQRKLNKNADKLTKLREEKRKILDQVMDKETYKVAVNLLARFGGVSNNRLSTGSTQRPSQTPLIVSNQSRALAIKPTVSQTVAVTPSQALNQQNRHTPFRPSNQVAQTTSQSVTTTPEFRVNQQLRRRTPFPIVNQAEKTIFERCLDFIIGDGPQDRFAIICKECHSHNGMALKEEFDYIAYRCAFCNAMNPARKTRPVAPRLSFPPISADGSPRLTLRRSDSSNSTATSDSSDDEHGEQNKRRVQLRLTESTANQSESPEINNHEEVQTVSEPVIAEHQIEEMEIVDDINSKLPEFPSANQSRDTDNYETEAMDISGDDNSKSATPSPNNDVHKKID